MQRPFSHLDRIDIVRFIHCRLYSESLRPFRHRELEFLDLPRVALQDPLPPSIASCIPKANTRR